MVNDEAGQLASALLAFRRNRSQFLPRDIFGEPAWELLLEVFIADDGGAPMTGRIAAERSGTAYPVMSRWLKYLSMEGLLIGDGAGDLDDQLTLSGIGMAAIEEALIQMRQLKDALSVKSSSGRQANG